MFSFCLQFFCDFRKQNKMTNLQSSICFLKAENNCFDIICVYIFLRNSVLFANEQNVLNETEETKKS